MQRQDDSLTTREQVHLALRTIHFSFGWNRGEMSVTTRLNLESRSHKNESLRDNSSRGNREKINPMNGRSAFGCLLILSLNGSDSVSAAERPKRHPAITRNNAPFAGVVGQMACGRSVATPGLTPARIACAAPRVKSAVWRLKAPRCSCPAAPGGGEREDACRSVVVLWSV